MALLESAHLPLCTYRVQLNPKFAFNDLASLIGYFRSLGVSDFYLSPIFTATPGSLHGYDVTDYNRVNPDLGGGDGFDLLATRLRLEGLAILLDFVPNHMGIAGVLNRWWRDVLETGRLSPYASFFDIQWKDESGGGHPRILVPILEDHYGKVLEEGKITLVFNGEFAVRYGEAALPLRPSSQALVLEQAAADADEEGRRAIAPIVEGLRALPDPGPEADSEIARKRADEIERLKKEFASLMEARPGLRRQLEAHLGRINGTAGDAASFDRLHALIEMQHYRLARWKAGTHEINYRRFFAIDSLVGMHVEKPEVFRECHELLGRFVREGKIGGLRIDHIDGLRQPEEYLRRLQSLDRPDASKPLYVLVEKIMAGNERLPEGWATHGTTGYEFILQLAGILVDSAAEGRFDEIYSRFTGERTPYRDLVYEKKRLIIGEMFVNAVSNLGAELVEILASDRWWRDLTRHELTTAVSELMANMPCYRTYRKSQEPASPQDRRMIEEACGQALARNPRADPQPFEFVRDLLTGAYPRTDVPEDYRRGLLSWVLTFQQYTGAVNAKSVEDTVFYVYNRLIALNEVGCEPDRFGGTVEQFHRSNAERLALCPHTLLATSTHDTKLSEDVRARLYALSELPDEWEGWVRAWTSLTERHATVVNGAAAPDSLDQYRFFQTLLGAWPLEEADVDAAFRGRLRQHFRKAVSEAKRHASILQSNEAYLEACDRFVDGITTPESAPDFMMSFAPCAHRIARLGMVNSLAQLVLKCTVPGVPDFYQGNEIWDFSLVDPDNRRDVDFGLRARLIERAGQSSVAGLLETWRDGRIKLRVMQLLLRFRDRHPALFSQGEYRAVEAEGGFRGHVVAFLRSHEAAKVLVVVPRLTAVLGSPPLGLAWDDTRLPLPENSRAWRDLFTDRVFTAHEPLLLRALFSDLPFAVLESA